MKEEKRLNELTSKVRQLKRNQRLIGECIGILATLVELHSTRLEKLEKGGDESEREGTD